jgi:hypothetical protein
VDGVHLSLTARTKPNQKHTHGSQQRATADGPPTKSRVGTVDEEADKHDQNTAVNEHPNQFFQQGVVHAFDSFSKFNKFNKFIVSNSKPSILHVAQQRLAPRHGAQPSVNLGQFVGVEVMHGREFAVFQ